MVIGQNFAWAHLPKTGGSATLELFLLFPEVIVFADVDDSNAKHTLFTEREQEVRDKQLVMNIRRLPYWVLSRAQHAARWGVHPDYKPIPMASAAELSESDFPDDRLRLFTGDGRLAIDAWIRMEHLVEDFLAFISRHTSVSAERREAARRLPMVNAHEYEHDLAEWFTADQIARMYERNSLWASLEERLYGNLVSVHVSTTHAQSPDDR
jgi:hypothetical protein